MTAAGLANPYSFYPSVFGPPGGRWGSVVGHAELREPSQPMHAIQASERECTAVSSFVLTEATPLDSRLGANDTAKGERKGRLRCNRQ